MPNAISCAYFAARNHVYGQKEGNPFRKGIATVQAARTVDAAAKMCCFSGPLLSPVSYFFDGAAKIGRKIVYPLIIGSGVYNTFKSKDKVKTGVSQGSGIGTMYLFEKVSEKLLKNISNKLNTNAKFTNSKPLRVLWYVAKGLMFASSSLLGYSAGSKAGECVVNKIREKKALKTAEPFPIEEGLKESDIFADMKL